MALTYLVDISTIGQGSKGVLALADPNCLGAFAKGTEGVGFKDPDYHLFYDAAKARHKPCGPYMFLHPDEDGRAQARYLLAYTRPVPGDFEPVVDTETNSRSGGMRKVAATTYDALDELRKHGFNPLMYGSTYFLKQLIAYEPRLKEFNTWQAEYGPVLHRIPGLRVLLWQWTDKMVVAKGRLRVDGDRLLIRSVDGLRIPKGAPVRHPDPTPPKPKPPVAKRKPKGRDIPGAGDGTGGAYKPVVAKKPAAKPLPEASSIPHSIVKKGANSGTKKESIAKPAPKKPPVKKRKPPTGGGGTAKAA